MFLGFFWARTCKRIFLPTHAGLIMPMQACSCALPRNFNFLFNLFCFCFHIFVCLASFLCLYASKSLCFTYLIACLLAYVRIRVYVVFFQGFWGKNLRTHILACACRLDYVHAGLFLRAQTATQKP